MIVTLTAAVTKILYLVCNAGPGTPSITVCGSIPHRPDENPVQYSRLTEEKRMRNRYVILIAISLFTLFTLVAPGATNASAASVIAVSLRAERLARTSSCPTTVDFRGSITMNGRGTVKYTFERSDGATAPYSTLYFASAGTKQVSTSWTLGRSYSGYQKLKVIAPNRAESSESRFDLNCGGVVIDPPIPTPVSSVNISCPIETARTEMVSRLPEGWWQTPQIGRLVSVGIQTIGGDQTLVCRYNAYGTQVSVMRKFPEGRRDCRVTGTNRFTCR